MTKCNSFSSTVSEAASKPLSTSSAGSILINNNDKQYGTSLSSSQKPRKRLKTEMSSSGGGNGAGIGNKSASYHLRFVPVDSIKHAPPIIINSLETASFHSTNNSNNNKEFSLQFCSRERSLPYFKMIHGRLLLGAIDFNLQHVDMKAVFLLAEATVWMLKNILSKLTSRSNFRQNLRCESAFENYKQTCISDERIRLKLNKKNNEIDDDLNFEVDSKIFKKQKNKSSKLK
jgi:hypothetical protein